MRTILDRKGLSKLKQGVEVVLFPSAYYSSKFQILNLINGKLSEVGILIVIPAYRAHFS